MEGAGFSEVSVTEYMLVVSHVMPPTLKPDMMNFCYLSISLRGQDSSVGIVTPYGLDGLGIDFWWGEIFRTCPDWSWASCTMGTRSLSGGKEAGEWHYPPTPI